MAGIQVFLQVGIFVCVLITFSEQCMPLNFTPGNVGLGNFGVGNVGVGNMGFGNKGVFNRGFRNIGVLNRKTASSVGVANFMRYRRLGVTNYIGMPNLFVPVGRR